MTTERDERGRFAPGNPGGPGRPAKERDREYLTTLISACPPERQKMRGLYPSPKTTLVALRLKIFAPKSIIDTVRC